MEKVVVTIRNSSVSLVSASPPILRRLKRHFTLQKVATGILQHRKSRWNGSVSFFSLVKAGGKVATPLLPEVLSLLSETQLQVDDLRPPLPEWSKEEALSEAEEKEKNLSFFLRDYQLEVVRKMRQKRLGVVQLPPGSGKTRIFAALIAQVRAAETPPRVVLLFRNVALMTQTQRVLEEVGVPSTIVGGGQKEVLFFFFFFFFFSFQVSEVTLATLQSLHHIDKKERLRFEVLIADECHLMTSANSLKLLASFSNTVWRFGFSATAFKPDDDIHNHKVRSLYLIYIYSYLIYLIYIHFFIHLFIYLFHLFPFIHLFSLLSVLFFFVFFQVSSVLGHLIFSLSHTLLSQQQVLSPVSCFFHVLSSPSLSALSYQSQYLSAFVHNKAFHRKVQSIVLSYSSDQRILILVRHIAHGQALHALLPQAHFLQGADSEERREYVLDKLRSGPVPFFFFFSFFFFFFLLLPSREPLLSLLQWVGSESMSMCTCSSTVWDCEIPLSPGKSLAADCARLRTKRISTITIFS
jgi:hypothetical protein